MYLDYKSLQNITLPDTKASIRNMHLLTQYAICLSERPSSELTSLFENVRPTHHVDVNFAVRQFPPIRHENGLSADIFQIHIIAIRRHMSKIIIL